MDKLHFPLRIALTDFITFVFVSYYCIFVYLAAILQSVGSFCVVFATSTKMAVDFDDYFFVFVFCCDYQLIIHTVETIVTSQRFTVSIARSTAGAAVDR